MSNLDISSNPFLQSVSNSNSQSQASEESDLGQDAFLKLMIAQLENQDPLSPAENGEFIAQLAQFSSVEGITNLNTSVGDLVSEFRSSRALEASALVGRAVDVNSNTGRLPEDGQIFGTVEIPSNAQNVQIRVETLAGELAHMESIPGDQIGDIAFAWDGVNEDGDQWSSGVYRLTATAQIEGEETALNVRVAANVNSVSMGSDSSLSLDVDGVGQVDIDDVKRFF